MGDLGLRRGTETCDQIRLSCSGQPAACSGSCVSGDHHSVRKPRTPPPLPTPPALGCYWGRWTPGCRAVLSEMEATSHLWLLKGGWSPLRFALRVKNTLEFEDIVF